MPDSPTRAYGGHVAGWCLPFGDAGIPGDVRGAQPAAAFAQLDSGIDRSRVRVGAPTSRPARSATRRQLDGARSNAARRFRLESLFVYGLRPTLLLATGFAVWWSKRPPPKKDQS